MWLFKPQYPICKRIIVNLRGADSPAFRGVLWQKRGGYLVLRNVELLKARGETTPLDGEVVVFQENVSFLQVIT